MPLDLDAILAADDRETVEVDVPEWGGTVEVRPISAKLRWRFESVVMGCRESGDWAPLADLSLDIVAEALGATKAQRSQLADKGAAALERVRDAALKQAGVSADDLEDAAEGFGTAPNGSSVTG